MLVTHNNGQPWSNQYDLNTVQSAEIGTWSTGTSLPETIHLSKAIVTKDRVYLLGGYVANVLSKKVYTAPINPDGTLGTWVSGTYMPETLSGEGIIFTQNNVYTIGGLYRTMPMYTNSIYKAAINPDGTLGSWGSPGSMNSELSNAGTIITKNRVYLTGGIGAGSYYKTTSVTAPINASGVLGVWDAWTAGPPPVEPIKDAVCISIGNNVYLIGGSTSTETYSLKIFKASFDDTGILGSWAYIGDLPTGITRASCVVTHNRIFILGGVLTGGVHTDKIYTAPIVDENIGAWSISSTLLPNTVHSSQVIVTNSKIYLLGGYVNNIASASVFVADFSGGYNDYLDKSYIPLAYNGIGGGIGGGLCHFSSSPLYISGDGGGICGGLSSYLGILYVGGTLYSPIPSYTGDAETPSIVFGRYIPKCCGVMSEALTTILANGNAKAKLNSLVAEALTTNIAVGQFVPSMSIIAGYTGDAGDIKTVLPLISGAATVSILGTCIQKVSKPVLRGDTLMGLACQGSVLSKTVSMNGVALNTATVTGDILINKGKLCGVVSQNYDSIIKYHRVGTNCKA